MMDGNLTGSLQRSIANVVSINCENALSTNVKKNNQALQSFLQRCAVMLLLSERRESVPQGKITSRNPVEKDLQLLGSSNGPDQRSSLPRKCRGKPRSDFEIPMDVQACLLPALTGVRLAPHSLARTGSSVRLRKYLCCSYGIDGCLSADASYVRLPDRSLNELEKDVFLSSPSNLLLNCRTGS